MPDGLLFERIRHLSAVPIERSERAELFCSRSEKGERFFMQLHLYVLPITLLSQDAMSPEPSEISSGKLTCLLQASGLPQGQRLEVRVNETLKKWRDGSTQVFSWELQEAKEEISIHLCRDTAEMASWRGLWKGNAIFHLGALPVQVFFNGMEQPLVDASTMIPIVDPSRDPFPTNGHEAGRALFPERPSVHDSEAPPPLVEIAEDPLTLDGDAEETDVQQEEQDDLQEEEDDTEDEELEDGEEDEEDEDENVEAEEEGQLVFEQDQLVLAEALSPAENTGVSTLQQSDALQSTPTLGKVAVFHADPAMADRTIERLKALLAMMPRKTAIIDLRELSRTRQKEEYSPLARAHLRADFGGRYWDRSQYIKTTYRSLPEAERTMSNQWERVVTNVETPDGLPFLENYVRAGYSMIFMDSTGRYAESARRAVMIAMRERIPTLEEVQFPA
jgi:hypothetical protein